MLFFIYIILIVFGLIAFYKSKYLDLIFLAFLVIMLVMSTKVADFENYYNYYAWIANGLYVTDQGLFFYWICKAAVVIGLSWSQLRIILVVISILLIRHTIRKILDTNYSVFIFALYFIYPILLDCIQIRFLLGEAVFFFAIPWLITHKKSDYIKYVCAIIIASSIHISCAFFLLFILAPFLLNKEKLFNVIVFTLFVCTILLRRTLAVLAARFVAVSRIERYFVGTDAVSIIGIITYSFTLIILCYITGMFLKTYHLECKNINQNSFLSVVNMMNKMCWLILPLTLFDTNFFRLQRPMWLLTYIAGSYLIHINGGYVLLLGNRFSIKLVLITLASIGCFVYVCIYSFSVISGFLM